MSLVMLPMLVVKFSLGVGGQSVHQETGDCQRLDISPDTLFDTEKSNVRFREAPLYFFFNDQKTFFNESAKRVNCTGKHCTFDVNLFEALG